MGKNLEKFMWKAMAYVGQVTLSLTDRGIVYNAPCSCGNPDCGDELVLSPEKDRLIWTRRWGGGDFWDRWLFTEDGDVEYLGTVQDDGFRYPPIMPE
jgi:hypothetical protein